MENRNSQNSKLALNQALIVVFLVVGGIAIAAVACNYAGDIQLKFGSDGIHLQINGAKKLTE